MDAFNDLTPRFGVAYDVFGNGKTALKFNMGHYLDAATNDSAYTRNNPANRIARGVGGVVTRNWSDTNGNKVVDCDLLNFAAQTAAVTPARALTGDNLNFGKIGTGLDAGQPGHARRLGRARERLAVGRDRAAGAPPARVAGSGLRPALVQGLHA